MINKTIKTILKNIMVFSTIIVMIELFSQLIYLVKTGEFFHFHKKMEKNEFFEQHPYLVGRLKASIKVTKDQKTITTTDHHTRWTGANSDDDTLIKIGVFGGSTTFGTGVTDEDSWPALLQQRLGENYAVFNYGITGYSTAENIIQMALIATEKRPQIVIFYEGWNDIKNYHDKELGVDYFSHGISQYENLNISSFKDQNEPNQLKNSFAFFRIINRIKTSLKGNKSPIKNILLSEAPDSFVDSIYIRNLYTLKLLAKNINAFPIFIPQVLNYHKFDTLEGCHFWSKNIKSTAMRDLMNNFNKHMEGLYLNKEQDGLVLNNVLKKNWVNSDFADYGHFSKKGGTKFVDFVFQAIKEKMNQTSKSKTN